MSVQGGGTETATWSTPQTSLSIYWGSIDGDVCTGGSQSCNNLNSISITGRRDTLTGAELIGMGAPSVLGEGDHFSPADNQLVTIKGLDPSRL